MKIRKGIAGALIAVAASMASLSANAGIELDRVQKKLDQFTEYNSCTDEVRSSKFASVFLYFNAENLEIANIGRAVIETDFSEFEVGFNHRKGEYYYSNIFGKEQHYEQLHTSCKGRDCSFNMVIYPKIFFPEGYDNTDVRITFYDQKNEKISTSKRNIGNFDERAFEKDLIPFQAYMEDQTIMVRKLPSNHKAEQYVVGLHVGFDGVKHEIDVVVNRNQAEEGVLVGYPGYSNVTYLGIYLEPSDYDDEKNISRVESKIELYDSEKEFFQSCKP